MDNCGFLSNTCSRAPTAPGGRDKTFINSSQASEGPGGESEAWRTADRGSPATHPSSVCHPVDGVMASRVATGEGEWGKGSRQVRSLTSEKGLALVSRSLWTSIIISEAPIVTGTGLRDRTPYSRWGGRWKVLLPNQWGFGVPEDEHETNKNWHGPGESDCLIKTKHCDGRRAVLTQCDFCPVL
ncbi:hypothetical protein TNIN_430261 [Trichonephila inaurata madagascariensis]|uniref:Uncharacterized protein n=1 Tax=Trichonephila inaurata madagascariensis TaxID=2747483 RepID=A0A8X6K471_9ARAC|nr:hypothetical protein TNIN_430261 [Trichonephila inaurata madagascariensis]